MELLMVNYIEIRTYLNTHNCSDTRVFNWCVLYYKKLKSTILSDKIKYFDNIIFNKIVDLAQNETLLNYVTENGKFTIVDKTECGIEDNGFNTVLTSLYT